MTAFPLPGVRLVPTGGRIVAPTLTVYEVRHATPIPTGPAVARLNTLGGSTIAGSVAAPGSYRLRVQTTPYLQVRAGNVCVKTAQGGESTLVVRTTGRFELAIPENPLDLIDESALASRAYARARSTGSER